MQELKRKEEPALYYRDYRDYFISKDFSDMDRLQSLIAVAIEKFEASHVTHTPIISPDLKLKYAEFPLRVEIPVSTAQPEDVLDQLIPFYQNCVNWGAPGAMFNVTPPSNIIGVAINVLTTLLNPNLAEDRSGGLTAFAEQEVVRCLGKLVKWDEEKVTGMACFGGKATNLYASRNAIAHCRSVLKDDFRIDNAFYISTDRGHPCQTEGAALQGIPSVNNVVLPCMDDGKMDLEALYQEVDTRLQKGQIFLGLTLNAGTTMEYIVDDIEAIVKIRNEMKEKHNLPYYPMIHADAVLGWVWLFMDKFDEVKLHNKETLPSTILKIKEMYNQVKHLKLVDSLGVDFHKLGYTAYQSSFYISQSLGKSTIRDMKFSQLSTYKGTIELSRGAQGVMSALGSLLSFGYEGYINLITNLLNSVEIIRRAAAAHPMLHPLDSGSLGVCNVVTFTHKKPLVEEELTQEDIKLINDMNEAFVHRIQEKLNRHETGLYFSFSKSYLEPGKKVRYGGLKMYATSPHLEGDNLKEFLGDFMGNVEEFLKDYNHAESGKIEKRDVGGAYHPIF